MLIWTYSILLFGNFLMAFSNKKSKMLYLSSLILLAILFCGHIYVGNGDANDFLGYFQDYYRLNITDLRDFGFYYLFYSTQVIGKIIGLSFYQWWISMTVIMFLLISYTIRKFNLGYHYFLCWMMAYYAFVMYSGLKFFYGFCLAFTAICFMCRDEKKDRLRFVFFIVLAGGMHVMYYFFLLLLLSKSTFITPKKIFAVSATLFCGILIIGRDTFTQNIQPIINSMVENENINSYFQTRTQMGFIIPIAIHLLVVLYTKRLYFFSQQVEVYAAGIGPDWEYISEESNATRILYNISLLLAVTYPLFLFSLTFTRLITSFSLIAFTLSTAYLCKFKNLYRLRLLIYPTLTLTFFIIYNFFLNDYITKTVIPMFDNYILRMIF